MQVYCKGYMPASRNATQAFVLWRIFNVNLMKFLCTRSGKTPLSAGSLQPSAQVPHTSHPYIMAGSTNELYSFSDRFTLLPTSSSYSLRCMQASGKLAPGGSLLYVVCSPFLKVEPHSKVLEDFADGQPLALH